MNELGFTKEDIQDTISCLKGYNFFLLQVSKSKVRTKKERINAKEDIEVISLLIEKYKKLLEVYNENWKRIYVVKSRE